MEGKEVRQVRDELECGDQAQDLEERGKEKDQRPKSFPQPSTSCVRPKHSDEFLHCFTSKPFI